MLSVCAASLGAAPAPEALTLAPASAHQHVLMGNSTEDYLTMQRHRSPGLLWWDRYVLVSQPRGG